MLSTHCKIKIVRDADYKASGIYETRDFYLACFLRCIGYKLTNLRPEGRRRFFIFKDQPQVRDDGFYSASARPLGLRQRSRT